MLLKWLSQQVPRPGTQEVSEHGFLWFPQTLRDVSEPGRPSQTSGLRLWPRKYSLLEAPSDPLLTCQDPNMRTQKREPQRVLYRSIRFAQVCFGFPELAS